MGGFNSFQYIFGSLLDLSQSLILAVFFKSLKEFLNHDSIFVSHLKSPLIKLLNESNFTDHGSVFSDLCPGKIAFGIAFNYRHFLILVCVNLSHLDDVLSGLMLNHFYFFSDHVVIGFAS